MSNAVPTTIVTGFLGAGKTTIVNHLVEHLQSQGQTCVYIKNEIGDEDLDGQLMRTKQVVAKELLNGCICCTLVGPFLSAITEVVESYHPDRIIIEASGAADPAALALMVAGHPLLRRDAVLSVIDVVNFDGYEDLTITAQNQTRLTDLIIFNKVELVDQARKEAVVGYVRELNTHSPIIEASEGKIDPEVAFGASTLELSKMLEAAPETAHNHVQHDELQAFKLELKSAMTETMVEAKLALLPQQIFRVKGVVVTPEGVPLLLNRVAKRTTCEPTELTPPNHGFLLFIGYRAHDVQSEVVSLFSTE